MDFKKTRIICVNNAKNGHCEFVVNQVGFTFGNISNFTFSIIPRWFTQNDTFVCCSCGIVLENYGQVKNHFFDTAFFIPTTTRPTTTT